MESYNEIDCRNLLEKVGNFPKIVRIDTILKLAKHSANVDILKQIQQIEIGDDPEIADIAKEAALTIKNRLVAKSTNFSEKKGIFSVVHEEVDALINFIREHHEKLAKEQICSAGAFICRFGRQNDAMIIFKWLENADLTTALFLLESVTEIASSEIEEKLSKYLNSTNPLIKSKAIIVKRRTNELEALAKLSEMLVSKETDERFAGVLSAQYFPFQEIKDLLLNLFEKEADLRLLTEVGKIFVANPKLETALDLLNKMEILPADKKEVVNSIFLNLSKALAENKILLPEEAAPKALIQRWQKERLAAFLKNIEIQLRIDKLRLPEKVEKWLLKYYSIPEVKNFVTRLARNPDTERIAHKILSELESTSNVEKKEVSVSPEATNIEEFGKLADDKRLIIFSSLKKDTFPKFEKFVREEAEYGKPEIKAVCLNLLTEYSSSSEDTEIARKVLSREDDPKLKIASFKLLQRRDFTKLLPMLKSFISSDIPDLKVRAFSLVLEIDPDNAFFEAVKMLRSENDLERAQAVPLLFYFPFPKVKKLVIESLKKEVHSEIAETLILLLISNPEKEILEILEAFLRTKGISKNVLLPIARAVRNLYEALS
ncbi:MAG: hypothetical protein HQM08_00580 [Candidatus Riflebacteria bacterium]|nr:hypothetical protein [Candidatus Riflebacteria bacterium]